MLQQRRDSSSLSLEVLLAAEFLKLESRQRLRIWIVSGLGFLLIVSLLAVFYLGRLAPRESLALVMRLFSLQLLCIALLMVSLFRGSGERPFLFLVAQRRDELGPDQANWLIDALRQEQRALDFDEQLPAVRKDLETQLLSFLPKLNEAQCLALTPPQRTYLRDWVKRGSIGQQVAALLVLATARDEKTKKWAELLSRETVESNERVREAARDFLKEWGE
jgi:hypothetical protein